MIREIVHIDEEKCDGCGLCVPACHEGAIQIIDGKARLVKDNLCDGLGACLGHCPQMAIWIEQREAEAFDEQAVEQHIRRIDPTPADPQPEDLSRHAPVTRQENPASDLAAMLRQMNPQPESTPPARPSGGPVHGSGQGGGHGGCPSSRFINLGGAAKHDSPAADADFVSGEVPSELRQWPVQLRLLPPNAPMFREADLLLAADCAAFACGDFHRRLLKGHVLAIACPKLDAPEGYVEKLTEIIRGNQLRSIVVAHMQVPCCSGIVRMAVEARRRSGVDLPIEDVVISTQGEILQRQMIPIASEANN